MIATSMCKIFKFYRTYLTLDFHTNTVLGGTFALITHDPPTSAKDSSIKPRPRSYKLPSLKSSSSFWSKKFIKPSPRLLNHPSLFPYPNFAFTTKLNNEPHTVLLLHFYRTNPGTNSHTVLPSFGGTISRSCKVIMNVRSP